MNDTGQPPDSLDEDALRRRLINRIAFAGVAIVALLGGLAIIDGMYVASPASKPKVAISQQITNDNIKPLVAVDVAPPVAEEAALPAAVEPTEPPEPPKPQAIPTIKSPPAKMEESASPSVPLEKQLRPLTQGAKAGRHFVLQVGVFNNIDNAKELLARLQKNEVPAQIEARVQVGPFKTKVEADMARAKLKAMGLETGLIMSIRR